MPHSARAVSSGVEHVLHTDGVAGSKPAPPTNENSWIRPLGNLRSKRTVSADKVRNGAKEESIPGFVMAVEDQVRRDPLPADVKRAILVEAGHRCAIPTCGAATTEVAHIVPW